eukprot:TRINITY_DN4997_c0_g1_i1.p1 TRINITY_DN4997_c0_g1~~TRINITY_DN4997_c0_g1_i1.p1  ORF type:complete len:405 (+),score=90.22 TRINITY_DN4997_c0_g1_i1:354-1568(+)
MGFFEAFGDAFFSHPKVATLLIERGIIEKTVETLRWASENDKTESTKTCIASLLGVIQAIKCHPKAAEAANNKLFLTEILKLFRREYEKEEFSESLTISLFRITGYWTMGGFNFNRQDAIRWVQNLEYVFAMAARLMNLENQLKIDQDFRMILDVIDKSLDLGPTDTIILHFDKPRVVDVLMKCGSASLGYDVCHPALLILGSLLRVENFRASNGDRLLPLFLRVYKSHYRQFNNKDAMDVGVACMFCLLTIARDNKEKCLELHREKMIANNMNAILFLNDPLFLKNAIDLHSIFKINVPDKVEEVFSETPAAIQGFETRMLQLTVHSHPQVRNSALSYLEIQAMKTNLPIKVELHSPPAAIRCNCCQSEAPSKRCSRCKSVAYCSIDCQKRDWGIHKVNCNPK